MVWHSYHRARIEKKQFQKKHFQDQDSAFCSHEKNAKQLTLIAQSIFKLDDSERKTLRGYIVTYIGVGVEDMSQRLAHETNASEVTWLALDLLILL
jgi:hypothetical protein